MYLHEAMRQSDRKQFLEAMQKEVEDQMRNGNFEFKRRSLVPMGAQILRAVWVLRRKRRIQTQEVHKGKARLNGRQIFFWVTEPKRILFRVT